VVVVVKKKAERSAVKEFWVADESRKFVTVSDRALTDSRIRRDIEHH